MINTIIILMIAILAGTTGDLVLSKTMRVLHEEMPVSWGNFFVFFVRVFQTPGIWLGIGCLAVFFFLYLIALSRAEVSYVLPLTALSYFLTALFARYFLHEHVTWLRMGGTILIVVGVICVALSTPPEQKKNLPAPSIPLTPNIKP